MPQILYEVIFETKDFNNKADWPAEGQPFVWSFGDGFVIMKKWIRSLN